nr:hypothetical protein [Lysinibacillus sp. 2017]
MFFLVSSKVMKWIRFAIIASLNPYKNALLREIRENSLATITSNIFSCASLIKR